MSGPWYAQEFQKLPSTGIPVLVCKLNRAGNPSPFDEPLVLPSRAVAGYCTSERCVQGPPSLAVWQRRSDGSGRYWNAWMCECGWSWYKKYAVEMTDDESKVRAVLGMWLETRISLDSKGIWRRRDGDGTTPQHDGGISNA